MRNLDKSKICLWISTFFSLFIHFVLVIFGILGKWRSVIYKIYCYGNIGIRRLFFVLLSSFVLSNYKIALKYTIRDHCNID